MKTAQTAPTVEDRMKRQAITFHDLARNLYAKVREEEARSGRATERGDYQGSARHLAAAESMTEWANTLIGPGWKAYAKEHEGDHGGSPYPVPGPATKDGTDGD
ncbi:hypothetical protein [Streptomyces sp. NBC_01314]|uniref:hypothetical protein n=1 Tax=Streptomyces sp. NBC_01314 TaxID=2903821 RepID=UPI0030868681|nr:hypothetical protein OG622_50265 [Streptomyces sp. NBC_01314]